MLKIEFDPDNYALAAALGAALTQYAGGTPAAAPPTVDEAAAAETQAAETQAAETEDEDNAPITDTRVDEHGVPFHKDYCSTAAEPFYKSGPNKGQWKKKKGVDESAYNEWHAANMPDPAPEPQPEPTGETAAAAFGQQQPQHAPAGNAPADVPQLMKWIAEQKQAGNLEDARVQAAWGEAGTNIGAVFQMSPDDQAAVVQTVYSVLTA